MPVSKKRKKKGKPVKRGSDRLTGLTLGDLLKVAAYQHYEQQGAYEDDAVEGVELPETFVDFEDPTAEAVIRAVADASKLKENKDG